MYIHIYIYTYITYIYIDDDIINPCITFLWGSFGINWVGQSSFSCHVSVFHRNVKGSDVCKSAAGRFPGDLHYFGQFRPFGFNSGRLVKIRKVLKVLLAWGRHKSKKSGVECALETFLVEEEGLNKVTEGGGDSCVMNVFVGSLSTVKEG